MEIVYSEDGLIISISSLCYYQHIVYYSNVQLVGGCKFYVEEKTKFPNKEIYVRENWQGNQELTIQSHCQHLVYKTQDENKNKNEFFFLMRNTNPTKKTRRCTQVLAKGNYLADRCYASIGLRKTTSCKYNLNKMYGDCGKYNQCLYYLLV